MDVTGEMIEEALEGVLPEEGARPAALSAALRWAVLGGGKRVRPRLCLAAAQAVGGTAQEALMPACAIELLHAYTLVHDDLPSMDGDELRRGRASVWAKFGEANAILAGDALQALAFATAARAPRQAGPVVAELARYAQGVVAGQVEDVAGVARDEATVAYVYEHKTADLFQAAVCMGGWAGGGSPEHVEALRRYGLHLGLAFQYEDDLLDGDSPFPPDETHRRVEEATRAALAALKGFSGEVSPLECLARKLVTRAV